MPSLAVNQEPLPVDWEQRFERWGKIALVAFVFLSKVVCLGALLVVVLVDAISMVIKALGHLI